MTNQPTDRTRQRLATLLQQAQEFRQRGNDGEADAALARAEEIMMKYALDAADALVSDVNFMVRDAVDKLVIPLSGIYRRVQASVLAMVVRAFGTAKTIIADDWDGKNKDQLWIIAHTSELDRLRVLTASIQMQLDSALQRFWSANKHLFDGHTAMQKFKARRQFMLAFGHGVAERIERARAAQIQEHPGVALVLERDMQEVDDFFDQFATRPVKTRMSAGSIVADVAGFQAGMATNTGDAPVGSSSRPLIGR